MVEPLLDMLPLETQKDIVSLFTYAPSELEEAARTFREYLLNTEFDDPKSIAALIFPMGCHLGSGCRLRGSR